MDRIQVLSTEQSSPDWKLTLGLNFDFLLSTLLSFQTQ